MASFYAQVDLSPTVADASGDTEPSGEEPAGRAIPLAGVP
jgi:hypothetical protein